MLDELSRKNRAFFSQIIALDVANAEVRKQTQETAKAEQRKRTEDGRTGYNKSCVLRREGTGYWLSGKAARQDDGDCSNELLIGCSEEEKKQFTAKWESKLKAAEEMAALKGQALEVVTKLRSPLLTRWRRPPALVLPQVSEVKALFAQQQQRPQHPTSPSAGRGAPSSAGPHAPPASPPLSPSDRRHEMVQNATLPPEGAIELRPTLRRMLDVRAFAPVYVIKASSRTPRDVRSLAVTGLH